MFLPSLVVAVVCKCIDMISNLVAITVLFFLLLLLIIIIIIIVLLLLL